MCLPPLSCMRLNRLGECESLHFVPNTFQYQSDCVKSNLPLDTYEKCSSSCICKVAVTWLRLMRPRRCIKIRTQITQLCHTSAPALSAMTTIILSIILPDARVQGNIVCNDCGGYAVRRSQWLTCTHSPCGLRSIRSVSNEASLFQQ